MEPIPLSFDPADGELHRILLHVLTLGGADVGAAEPEALVSRALECVATTPVQALARDLLEGLGRWVVRGHLDLERLVGGALATRDPGKVSVLIEVLGRLAHLPEARSRLLGLRRQPYALHLQDSLRTALSAPWPAGRAQGGPPEEVRNEIFAAREDDRDLTSYPARLAAVSYLIHDDRYSERSIGLCLAALDYGTHCWEDLEGSPAVRRQALRLLGQLEPAHLPGRVYAKLLEVMARDEDGGVRDAAYQILLRQALAPRSARSG